MEQNSASFGSTVVKALLHFLYMIVYVLFLCPFGFWKVAAQRLAIAKENKAIDVDKIKSRWPYFSFCKRILFDFVFDGFIFMSYFIGVLSAFYVLFESNFESFIITLIGFYYMPFIISMFRDLTTWALLPIQKFLSWCAKPAQQLDLDVHNHDK